MSQETWQSHSANVVKKKKKPMQLLIISSCIIMNRQSQQHLCGLMRVNQEMSDRNVYHCLSRQLSLSAHNNAASTTPKKLPDGVGIAS